MEKKEFKNDRRKFLKKVGTLSTMVTVLPRVPIAESIAQMERFTDANQYTFLFQGDSITEGGRSRDMDWNHILGQDYVYLISSRLWLDFPKKGFHFWNRGTSGATLSDMGSGWQKDALDLKPHLVSILIGINDVSSWINGDKDFTAERYEREYRALLRQTKQALPNVELVLGEPFVLPGARVTDRYDDYLREVKKRRAVVKKLSQEFNTIFIPYQDLFDKALQLAPVDYWIWDGIHPMPAGHELMAREWIRLVGQRLAFLQNPAGS